MEMERATRIGSPKKLQTNLLCIPKLKNTKNSSNNNNKAAKALLDRIREAIFRLIMLSAISSSSSSSSSSSNYNSSTKMSGGAHRHVSMSSPASLYDNSEAVADCIEFIKKKAGPEEFHV